MKCTISLLLLLFAGFSSSLILTDGPRTVNKVLRVNNGGYWGKWQDAQFCPTGAFATGYAMKIEGKQGNGDDTSLNSLKLHCGFIETDGYGGEITSGQGGWGSWGADFKCGDHNGLKGFLTSFVMQVEAPGGGTFDDTAANYVKFKCRDLSATYSDYQLSSGTGFWGSYGDWSESCPANSAICGLKTRIEGHGGDDTAFNNVEFYCCTY